MWQCAKHSKAPGVTLLAGSGLSDSGTIAGTHESAANPHTLFDGCWHQVPAQNILVVALFAKTRLAAALDSRPLYALHCLDVVSAGRSSTLVTIIAQAALHY